METMPVASGVDAFAAFQNQLRTLCLNEFPCGSGSWRTSSERNIPDARFAVTLKDYGADKEQEETLEELVTSKFSPYSVDYSWSDEAKALREIAVKSPWRITQEFVYRHFKTLRVVDKNVSHLDPSLLKLTSLEELTVSVNHLSTVHSSNIPRSVKVLELVANEIEDLEQLCADPPPELQHLGLGLNKISAIHDYITGQYWPCLLSLDLSHNNLCDLIEVISKVSTLPKLRNLVLLGNPLALIPGYRGFTVDSLRKLDILDDLQISADEKHHYKGLARRKEYVLDEAKVTVTVTAASGIPQPPELLLQFAESTINWTYGSRDKNTDEVPQYPITTRTYYVQFMFLEDFQAKTKAENESKETKETKKGEDKDADQEKDVVANGDGAEPVSNAAADGDKKEQPTITIEKENDDKEKDEKENDDKLKDEEEQDGTTVKQSDSPAPNPPETEAAELATTQSPPPALKLVPYRTEGLRWTEEGFQFKFSKELVIDDLPALKEYFKKGMPLAIKEDKVLSTPAATDENAEEGKHDAKAKDKDEFDSIAELDNDAARGSDNVSRLGKLKPRIAAVGQFNRAQSRVGGGGGGGGGRMSSLRGGTGGGGRMSSLRGGGGGSGRMSSLRGGGGSGHMSNLRGGGGHMSSLRGGGGGGRMSSLRGGGGGGGRMSSLRGGGGGGGGGGRMSSLKVAGGGGGGGRMSSLRGGRMSSLRGGGGGLGGGGGGGRMSSLRAGSRMRSQSKMSSRMGELPTWPGEKKKKKKEPEIELIHSPPEVTVLGTYNLEMAEFVEGEYVIEKTCTCKREGASAEEEEAVKEEESAEAKKDKKKKKDRGESAKGKKGKGDGKESKEGKDKDKDKDKGKKPSSKPDRKESKAKRPGSGKSQHSDDEEEKPPPPPLTVSISVELQHWKTAHDSIPKTTVTDKLALLEETTTE